MSIKDLILKKSNFIAGGILGLASLLYIVYGAKFAEIHIQFSFLDFPVFVGEIILLLSFIFFLIHVFHQRSFSGSKYVDRLAAVYMAFVLCKVGYGYWVYGPLALRHAALFYYPLVAFIVYCSLIRTGSFRNILRGVLPFILVLFLTSRFIDYWFLSLLVLGIAGILTFKSRRMCLVFTGLLLAIAPYKMFFYTARTMIMSNVAGILFLILSSYFMLKWPKKMKMIFSVLILILVIAGLARTSAFTAAGSIVRIRDIIDVFRQQDSYVQAKKPTFVMRPIKNVKLFTPNTKRQQIGETESGDLLNAIEREFDSVLTEVPSGGDQNTLSNIINRINEYDRYVTDLAINRDRVNLLSEDEYVRIQQMRKQIDSIEEKRQAVIILKTEEGQKVDPVIGFLAERVGNIGSNVKLAEQYRQEAEEPDEISGGSDEKISVDKNVLISEKVVMPSDVREAVLPDVRNSSQAVTNAIFRLFIWRDMIEEMGHFKHLFGFSFGRPLRSISIEICEWGIGEWSRDGWIESHNSYLDVMYRAGIFGFAIIILFIYALFCLTRKFILANDYIGILLTSIIINWATGANFLPLFELPYYSIPVWFVVGLAFAYQHDLVKRPDEDPDRS